MRKTWFALSALAAVAITASVAGRTEASPLGNPTALSGAVDELAVIDNVHCRSGWRHHEPNRWRRADGCRRYDRSGAVIVVPGRTRYVVRDGVRVRVRDGDRTRATIRSGDRTRSGEGTTVRSRTDVNVRGTTGTGTRQEGTGTRQEGGAQQGGTGGQQKGGGAQKGSGGQEKSN